MPFFRPQTRIYEARQYSHVEFAENGAYSAHFNGTEALPNWLRSALIDEEIYAHPGETFLSLGIEGEEVSVHPGDWIMYQEEVGIFVISGNELLEDFEEVPVVRQDATVQVTGVEARGLTLPFEGAPI
ncbi:hypothetical protein UFOVP1202_56 [uncultured Caudovirales phage]|uniref:Uncharacterized protein n=1 Tax=uncultured Caudovirales phage TaxID=2100421 RepID=A0A6J5R9U7_9CAUD|nr:hypothetical protein UFOVP1202_56 [uncultured Caudovirales phage]